MPRNQFIIAVVAAGIVVIIAIVAGIALLNNTRPANAPTATPTPVAQPATDMAASEISSPTTDPSQGANTAPTVAPSTTAATTANTAAADGPSVGSNAPNSSAEVYLDDRSGPAQLVASFVNALNRKEYLRAYSYFETPDKLGSFDTFAQGYANTVHVRLTTGNVTSDAGAGQLYYNVPLTFNVDITGGKQTFVGCYHLHMSQPSIQATPPFKPLAIQSISIQLVSEGTDPAPLMAKACAA